jgi:glycosyltransferase involved in cell wall biosynthesis
LRLRDAATAVLVRSAGHVAPQRPGHVTVAGLLSSQSGLGQTARLSAAALAELGLTVGQIDLTRLLRISVDTPLTNALPDAGGPILLHLNPPSFQSALLMRAVPLHGRKLIAYWVWEMPQVPQVWQRAFRLANEIWVPTNFVADALRASGCRTPIRVVPYPVRAPATPDVARRDNAAPLRVLTVFAYDSGFERKNPIAAVAAFREAFGDRTDVELLVKVRGHSTTGEPERRFTAAIAGMANVRVQAGSIAPDDYERLLAEADIVLSLHRAEGFGLVLAEAMLLGKPVVCTAWSGNLDFMTEATACLVPATLTPALDESDAYRDLQTHWAEPSTVAAADWLRRLEDPSLRHTIGDAARSHATECLGLGRFRSAVAASFGAAA